MLISKIFHNWRQKFKVIKQTINRLSEYLDLSHKFPVYFSVRIFRAAFIIISFIFLSILWLYGPKTEYVYIECTDYKPCFCPLPNICESELLMPGQSVGTKPPFLVKYFKDIVLSIMMLSFGVNHLIYHLKKGKVSKC